MGGLLAGDGGGVQRRWGIFFAKDLRAELKRPIGLIGTHWGGTPAQAWTPIEGLRKDPELKGYVDSHEGSAKNFDAAMAKYPVEEAKYKEDLAAWEKEVGPKFASEQNAWKKEAAAAKAANQPVPEQPKPERPKPVEPKNPNGGGEARRRSTTSMIAPLIPCDQGGDLVSGRVKRRAGGAVQGVV